MKIFVGTKRPARPVDLVNARRLDKDPFVYHSDVGQLM
jgi:hypothetical protein